MSGSTDPNTFDPSAKKQPPTPGAAAASRNIPVPTPAPTPTPTPQRSPFQAPNQDRIELDRLKADLAEKDAQPPSLPPPPKPQQPDAFQAFGQPAMWIAVLGSLFTRQPFVNALQAGAAVLKSTQQLDAQASQQAYNAWKTQTDHAMKVAQFQEKRYADALRALDVDAKAGKAQLETEMLAMKDEVLQQAYEHGGTDEVKKLLFARQKQTKATAAAAKSFDAVIKPQVNVAQDLASGDPERMADGLLAWDKMNISAGQGKGSTANTRQMTVGQDIRIQVLAERLRNGTPEEKAAAVEEGNAIIGAGVMKPPTAAQMNARTGDAAEIKADIRNEHPDWTPGQVDIEAKTRMKVSAPATISDDGARLIAEEFVGGNHQAATGMSRSPANIAKVQDQVAKIAQERGMDGDALNANFLEFASAQSAERRIGAAGAMVDQGARELSQLIPQAKEASANVVRWGAVPVDRLIQALKGASNDPELATFSAANQGVANAFALVMRRGGAPTDQSASHAYDLLSTARDDASYNAVLDQLNREAGAVLRSTSDTRSDITHTVTGRGGQSGGGAPPQAAADYLRANPGLAAQFDQKYGPGSAQRVLNGQ